MDFLACNIRPCRLGNKLFIMADTLAAARRHGLQPAVSYQDGRTIEKLFPGYAECLGLGTAHFPFIDTAGLPVQNTYRIPLGYAPLPAGLRNVTLEGYGQSEAYFCHEREEITRWLQHLMPGHIMPQSVGLHVRLGDFKLTTFYISTPAWIQRALLGLQGDYKSLFIFCEHEKECRKHLAPIMGMLNDRFRVYFMAGEDYSVKETLRGTASMQALVCSYSSFSWWGAYLGQANEVVWPDVSRCAGVQFHAGYVGAGPITKAWQQLAI